MSKYINKFKEILGNIPIIEKYKEGQLAITKVEELEEENRKLKVKYEDQNLIREVVKHEAGNSANPTIGILEVLYSGYDALSDEERKDLIEGIYFKSQDLGDQLGFTTIGEFSLEGLKKSSLEFSIGKMSEKLISSKEKDLNENNVRYSIYGGEVPELFTNPYLFSNLMGTCMGDAINHAPKGTSIKQGTRTIDGNLEILLENNFVEDKRRNIFGEGNGVGTKLREKAMEAWNGTAEEYSVSQIDSNNYSALEHFGLQDADKDIGELYGIKFLIPLENITKQESKS